MEEGVREPKGQVIVTDRPQAQFDCAWGLFENNAAMYNEVKDDIFFSEVLGIGSPQRFYFSGLAEKLPPFELVLISILRRFSHFIQDQGDPFLIIRGTRKPKNGVRRGFDRRFRGLGQVYKLFAS